MKQNLLSRQGVEGVKGAWCWLREFLVRRFPFPALRSLGEAGLLWGIRQWGGGKPPPASAPFSRELVGSGGGLSSGSCWLWGWNQRVWESSAAHCAEVGVGVGPGDARNKQTSSAGLPAPPWQDVCVFSADSI